MAKSSKPRSGAATHGKHVRIRHPRIVAARYDPALPSAEDGVNGKATITSL